MVGLYCGFSLGPYEEGVDVGYVSLEKEFSQPLNSEQKHKQVETIDFTPVVREVEGAKTKAGRLAVV